MLLMYRGYTAPPSPTAETVDTGHQGQFLGQSFPLRTHHKKIAERSCPTLQYRGVLD